MGRQMRNVAKELKATELRIHDGEAKGNERGPGEQKWLVQRGNSVDPTAKF